MSLATTLLQELEMEAATTRRVLERVPDAQLGWSPAPRSRTLGELAMHIATVPGSVMALAAQNPADLPGFGDVAPASAAQVLDALDDSLESARQLLASMTDTHTGTTTAASVRCISACSSCRCHRYTGQARTRIRSRSESRFVTRRVPAP